MLGSVIAWALALVLAPSAMPEVDDEVLVGFLSGDPKPKIDDGGTLRGIQARDLTTTGPQVLRVEVRAASDPDMLQWIGRSFVNRNERRSAQFNGKYFLVGATHAAIHAIRLPVLDDRNNDDLRVDVELRPGELSVKRTPAAARSKPRRRSKKAAAWKRNAFRVRFEGRDAEGIRRVDAMTLVVPTRKRGRRKAPPTRLRLTVDRAHIGPWRAAAVAARTGHGGGGQCQLILDDTAGHELVIAFDRLRVGAITEAAGGRFTVDVSAVPVGFGRPTTLTPPTPPAGPVPIPYPN